MSEIISSPLFIIKKSANKQSAQFLFTITSFLWKFLAFTQNYFIENNKILLNIH